MNKTLMVAISFLFFGCATPSYQKVNADGIHRTGYTDSKITETMYRITYLDISPELAYKNFLRRAAELSLEKGYKYFTTQDVGEFKEGARMVTISSSYSQDWALPKYEATVVFQKTKTNNAFSSEEILKTNPIKK